MKSRIAALLLAFLMVTALLPFGVSAARELPIYCVQRNDKVVSLTFDAAWGDDHTQALLNILNRYQIKSTFFLVSIWVGMVLGLVPVIGIPLPFFSYGGSSLIAFTMLLFIFIRQDADRNALI